MYSSRQHYQALASDRAMMLDEYMCKLPFYDPIYINMTWLICPSAGFTAPAIDSLVRAGL